MKKYNMYSSKPIKTRRLKVSKLKLICIPLVVFGVFTVYLGIETAGYGARLTQLEKKAHELEVHNKDLSQKMISSTSLTDLTKKSSELGFVKPTNIVYVGVPSVAQAP